MKKGSKVHASAYIAAGAAILGNVEIQEECSVWFNAVIRADRDFIRIGKHSNIQDNCVIHVDDKNPVVIGDDVAIGHGAIIHGCTIGNHTLIGMGAIILNGAKIGENCIIGAGTLVPQNTVIPDGMVAMGNPVLIKRQIKVDEIAAHTRNIKEYIELAKKYKAESES